MVTKQRDCDDSGMVEAKQKSHHQIRRVNFGDFIAISIYDLVTWVGIAVCVGLVLTYSFQGNWRGFYWSLAALVFLSFVMLAIRAKQYFWNGEAEKKRERPELYTSGAMMGPLVPGEPETVLVAFKNRGSTTARNICLGGGNHVFTRADFAGPLVYKPVPVQVRPDLGAGDEENTVISRSPQPLTEKQIDQLNKGEILFFHFAEGEYSDDSGNTYPIDYCYMFNPVSPTVMKVCPEKYWPKSRADRRGMTSLDAAPKPIAKPDPTPYTNIKWTEYTEDWFYDVIWRWHYKPPSKTPRDIRPYCPECAYENEMDHRLIFPERSPYPPYEQRAPYLRLWCPHHSQIYQAEHIPNMKLDDFSKIKQLIEGKLTDNSWRDVVIAQKKARDGKDD